METESAEKTGKVDNLIQISNFVAKKNNLTESLIQCELHFGNIFDCKIENFH